MTDTLHIQELKFDEHVDVETGLGERAPLLRKSSRYSSGDTLEKTVSAKSITIVNVETNEVVSASDDDGAGSVASAATTASTLPETPQRTWSAPEVLVHPDSEWVERASGLSVYMARRARWWSLPVLALDEHEEAHAQADNDEDEEEEPDATATPSKSRFWVKFFGYAALAIIFLAVAFAAVCSAQRAVRRSEDRQALNKGGLYKADNGVLDWFWWFDHGDWYKGQKLTGPFDVNCDTGDNDPIQNEFQVCDIPLTPEMTQEQREERFKRGGEHPNGYTHNGVMHGGGYPLYSSKEVRMWQKEFSAPQRISITSGAKRDRDGNKIWEDPRPLPAHPQTIIYAMSTGFHIEPSRKVFESWTPSNKPRKFLIIGDASAWRSILRDKDNWSFMQSTKSRIWSWIWDLTREYEVGEWGNTAYRMGVGMKEHQVPIAYEIDFIDWDFRDVWRNDARNREMIFKDEGWKSYEIEQEVKDLEWPKDGDGNTAMKTETVTHWKRHGNYVATNRHPYCSSGIACCGEAWTDPTCTGDVSLLSKRNQDRWVKYVEENFAGIFLEGGNTPCSARSFNSIGEGVFSDMLKRIAEGGKVMISSGSAGTWVLGHSWLPTKYTSLTKGFEGEPSDCPALTSHYEGMQQGDWKGLDLIPDMLRPHILDHQSCEWREVETDEVDADGNKIKKMDSSCPPMTDGIKKFIESDDYKELSDAAGGIPRALLGLKDGSGMLYVGGKAMYLRTA